LPHGQVPDRRDDTGPRARTRAARADQGGSRLPLHQNTLMALRELIQAAGLQHPREIDASHIVRRTSDHGVKLLANLLPFVEPGSLLMGDLRQQVFREYWPIATAASFRPIRTPNPLPV